MLNNNLDLTHGTIELAVNYKIPYELKNNFPAFSGAFYNNDSGDPLF
jgi:hypothetical protein